MSAETSINAVRQQEKGFSLVMSLIFISLLSVMVVGFLTTMRVEVFTADIHGQGNFGAQLAQAGTDMALSKLRYVMGGTSGLTVWASQPGRIMMATRSTATSSFGAINIVDLHSGAPNGYTDNDDTSADLNQNSRHLITNSTDKLLIKWIYVMKDGSVTTSIPVYTANSTNPPVGRFAFWVDDDTARVNINTAFTRNTTDLMGAASQVDLKAINSVTFSDTVLNALNSFRTGTASGQHYFNTLAEVTLASAVAGVGVNYEKFQFTTNSQAPDLNMFGEPRIVLTTQKRLAGGAPFLDILGTDNADPGPWANLSGASTNPPAASSKVNAVVNMLVQKIMSRTDWPGYSGKSFVTKYTTTASAVQIALNIIDYVRCKESAQTLVPPIRGDWTGSSFVFDGRNGPIIGVSRVPRITERAYVLLPSASTNPSTAAKQAQIKIIYEVHIPQYVGIPSLSLSSLYYSFYLSGRTGTNDNDPWTYMGGQYVSGSASALVATPTSIRPGEYSKVELMAPTELIYKGTYTRSSIVAFNGGSSAILNGVPAGNTDYYQLDYMQGGADIPANDTVTESNVRSIEINDPMVNHASGDWVPSIVGGTWGTASTTISTLNKAPSAVPPQPDTVGGKLTNVSLQIPYPAGTATNASGVVESVAELGYIHTGVGGSSSTAGVPWRSVRLQPRSDTATVPDWFLLDMFTAPKWRWTDPLTKNSTSPSTATPSYYLMSSMISSTSTLSVNQRIGGMINANATIYPNFPTSGTGYVTRTSPLMAAFRYMYDNSIFTYPATTMSATTAMVQNVSSLSLATGGSIWMSTSSATMLNRGQLAELKGITESSELDENRLRGVVDLLTTQGSVFRIYSIGQVVKQTSTSLMQVISERRTMTIVERANNATGTTVQFNTLYSGKPQ